MRVKSWLKRWVLSTLSVPVVGRSLDRLRGPRCVILMLHRFARTGYGEDGHRPEQVIALLEYLRAARVDVLPLDEAIARFAQEGDRPKRSAIAFTVDDCYTDLREVGIPLFARYDCAVTGFVVPDVVDGKCWYWWDHVEWLMRQAVGRTLSLELEGVSLVADCQTRPKALGSASLMCDALKLLPTPARIMAVDQLAEIIGTAIPQTPPAEYAVMTWDELRAAESVGMRFGPHTVSHPVLSRCSDEESRYEIRRSIVRLATELRNPSPVFCYPVGRREDFGVREMQTVQESGMVAAVSAIPGAITPHMDGRYGAHWRWAVPRFPYDGRGGTVARRLFL